MVPGRGTEGDEAHYGVLHLQHGCVLAVHHSEAGRGAHLVIGHAPAEDHVRLPATTTGWHCSNNHRVAL